MSVKELFNLNTAKKVIKSVTSEEIAEKAESFGNVKETIKNKERFIPQVDYSKPANFARFGSSAKYYEDTINRILDSYPYDGSLKERQEFLNKSSYLDLYIFEKEYPRTNGYVTFDGTSYIEIKGGPHTAPSKYDAKGMPKKFGEANIYDVDNNRDSNLEMDFTKGVSVEFWMKRSNTDPATDSIVFKLEEPDTDGGGSDTSSGLFQVVCKNNLVFDVTLMSASTTHTFEFTTLGVTPDDWNHIAFTVKSDSATHITTAKQYLNGSLVSSSITNYIFGKVEAPHKAYLAYSDFIGSLDEFRFWKTQRTSEDIGRHWFTQVGGGTNTDLANTDLGVYFKFNEGITGNSAIDSTILDYSGRFSNGTWVNYNTPSNFRSTGSAIIESSASLEEYEDPIIYEEHPDVQALSLSLKEKGEYHDINNNSSLYYSLPDWLVSEDSNENGHLKKLTQIMSSYLDTSYLQIQSLTDLNDLDYPQENEKPLPFSGRLLENKGFIAPEIFANADVLSKILDRDEKENFAEDLTEVKNLIYKNIYNNLIYIYKTKGTEKSFRNLMRCYGIDESLIRLNLYGNNIQYNIDGDNYTAQSVKKNYINFNHPDNFGATIYQDNYIDSSDKFVSSSFTMETSVLFPRKIKETESNYFKTTFLTSSLFGLSDPGGTLDISVYAIRDKEESKNVKFKLMSSLLGISLETDTYLEVYDNERWNFAIRVKPEIYASSLYNAVDSTNKYILEFYGINMDAGTLKNEFNLSKTLESDDDSKKLLTAPRRIYAGAHRQDFTGTLLKSTDVKISSVKYWGSYLENEELQSHLRDPQSYGRNSPYDNQYLYLDTLDYDDDSDGATPNRKVRIPQSDTLFLDWDFGQVSSSNATGEFTSEDISHTSPENTTKYGWYSAVSELDYEAKGKYFPTSSKNVSDYRYIYSAKQNGPEQLKYSDTVKILQDDNIAFKIRNLPQEFYFAFEKSMYQSINDEMLKMFSTIISFNNLIGEPVLKYRGEYKPLNKLRHMFFERVNNTPDLDKYIDFYRWIDDSLGVMLMQLIPASANFSEGVKNMIESHILERNKVASKFPLLERKLDEIEGATSTAIKFRGETPFFGSGGSVD